jgi:hypothetical protein
MSTFDIAGLQAALGPIATIADPLRIKNKSRDFYWYSPILRDALDDVRADLSSCPKTKRRWWRRSLPVTPAESR